MIYLILFFPISFILYSKEQFNEARGGKKSKWHLYGPAMRIIPFVVCFLCELQQASWQLNLVAWQNYLLAGALSIWVFEVGINVIALGMPWNYTGKTAITDKKLGKKKWLVYAGILIAAIAIKIFIK